MEINDLKKVELPLFYIRTHYVKIKVTGHVVAAANEQEALDIAARYNIHYEPNGEVKSRDAHPCDHLHKGRRIWYESNGILQSWIWTGESIDPTEL